ncbi:MAG: response regulator [Deltaproteobacteria bacterium]|nr:response regulator [Deltaproteobacteria bacterium]
MRPMEFIHSAAAVEKIHAYQQTCPETGLPIVRQADWLYVSKQHAYTTGVIAGALITTKATGYTDLAGVQKYCRIMDGIFAAKPDENHKYILLEDYSELKGADSAARKTYIDYFAKQDRHLLAVIFYNTTFQMNLSVRLGRALHIMNFDVELLDTYELALKRAGELLGVDFFRLPEPPAQKNEPLPAASHRGFSRELHFDDFHFSVEVIQPDIIHCVARGVLTQEYIAPIFEAQRQAIRALGPGDRPFYLVHGVEGTGVKDLSTRKQHLKGFKSLHKESPFEQLVIYGANRFLRAAILMGISFVPFGVRLVDDFTEATDLVSLDRQGKTASDANDPGKTSGRFMSAEGTTQDYVDDLMHFVGCIEWEKAGVGGHLEIDPSHPFLPVFDAISMIKDDLDGLFKSRQTAEKRLKESETKYRTILEEINDAFFEVDLKGHITFCNRALCDLVKTDRDEILGMNYSAFVDEGNISGVVDMFSRVYKTGLPEKAVYYVLTRQDGTVVHVETSASIKNDSEGKPVGFRGIVKDITHRKQIEAELVQHRDNLKGMVTDQTSQLRRSKAALQKILDSMPYGVVIVGTDKRIRYANQSALSLMGYETRESVRGRICHDTFSPSKKGECPVVDLCREMDRCEWVLRTRSGDTIPILKSVIRLTLDDEPVMLETFIDITDLKHAERELHQSKIIAEAANVAKSQFLANMSHEIRTPLNGIIGMAELAMDTPLSADQRKIIETIDKESSHLLEMINTVLDFSKIEAGKFQLESTPFDLRRLIEDVASSIAMRAKNNGLEFASFVSPDVPSRLTGDPGRLRQVLNNLAGNALKFTEAGEIIIRAKTVQDRGNHVRVHFEVTDTGIGIPVDRQEAIFEGFTQADGSTTRKYGGTGLGTTLSKQLVEMMGGEIGLISDPGKGSTFWFTAVFEKAPEENKTPPQSENGISGLKVMVVDDIEVARMIIMEYLTLFGCEVHECDGSIKALNGLEAAVASSRPFDLLISDIRMPEMDGFGLAARIRAHDALKEIPIILLSGIGSIGDGETCRQHGVDAYLHKPVKMKELEQAITLIRGTGKRAHPTARELVTRHTLVESRKKPVRLLLVEDYPTNQQVALNHLRNAGFQVDLAENGREAVTAYERNEYNMILMDIQMPVMDGYKATRTIRQMEAARAKGDTQTRRIPIIAMTAHSLEGDREKCLSAGTDDYISKPLKKDKLLSMVAKWIDSAHPLSAVPVSSEKKRPPDQDAAPMDYGRALEEFDNDKAFLMEVLTGFIKNVAGQIDTLREAAANGEADTVISESHSIKGGASNLTADALAGIAADLEKDGKAGVLTQANEKIENLKKELQRVEAFAQSLVA